MLSPEGKLEVPEYQNTEKPDRSASRKWERWRDAGEIFGRVKLGIGFGDLCLYESPGNHDAFSIQWWFHAAGNRYSQKICFNVIDIDRRGGIVNFSKYIVDTFKNDARGYVGDPTP